MPVDKSREEAVCDICCEVVSILRPRLVLWNHGYKDEPCAGSGTRNYSDVHVIRLGVPKVYRKIHTIELREHETLMRRKKTPGPRRPWRDRWEIKTGVRPK